MDILFLDCLFLKMAAKKKKKKNTNVSKQNCVIHISDIEDQTFVFLNMQKLQKLKEIAETRLTQAANIESRFEHICQQIPNSIQENDGYHRQCYQKFTRNLKRIRVPSPYMNKNESQISKVKRTKGDGIKFQDDCILCNQQGHHNVKKNKTWTTEKLLMFKRNNW